MTNKMLHMTDSILLMIVKMLEKDVGIKYHEEERWVKINRESMAKVLRCTITHHINRLVNLGIIKRMKLSRYLGDCTNYYSINPKALDDLEIRNKLLPPLLKRIAAYIDIDNKNNNNKSNKSINGKKKNI